MKILLAVSLILNVVLGVLYFQEKNQPPIERIILEHSDLKVTEKKINFEPHQKTPHAKAAMMVNTLDAHTEEAPIVVQDEQTFIQASEELLRAQSEYLERELEISDKDIKRKTKLTNDFYQQSGILQKKTPFGVRMAFQDRRKEIDLEEKLHQDYARLLGSKKWEQYRKWVDDYNQKLIKNHKSREFSPLMMSY